MGEDHETARTFPRRVAGPRDGVSVVFVESLHDKVDPDIANREREGRGLLGVATTARTEMRVPEVRAKESCVRRGQVAETVSEASCAVNGDQWVSGP